MFFVEIQKILSNGEIDEILNEDLCKTAKIKIFCVLLLKSVTSRGIIPAATVIGGYYDPF